jgi:hypothetical protein
MSPQRELLWIIPSMVLYFQPQWICSVSPSKEISQILPQWSFIFSSPMDLFRVSSERTFTDFTLSGFSFISNPNGFSFMSIDLQMVSATIV